MAFFDPQMGSSCCLLSDLRKKKSSVSRLKDAENKQAGASARDMHKLSDGLSPHTFIWQITHIRTCEQISKQIVGLENKITQ
jgi:hypothetical protein